MKKSKKLAAIKSLRRRRRVRNAQLEALDKRLVLSGSPPVAANDLFAVQQDTPLSITAPGLLTNDSDPEGDSLTASLFSGPAHGTLALQADGSFSYTPDAGFAGVDSFTYQADDGTSKSALAAVTLKVGAGGAAPTIDLDADDNPVPGADFIATFTEGGGPVLLADTDAALADADSSKLASLTVTITNLHDGALENLSADTSGTAITASYDSGSGVLTLSGSDSVADYLQVLKTVSYDNASQHPDTTDRIITFVASDGLHDSNVATTTLSVVGVNNPPTATNDSYAISEDNTLNIPSGGVLANDTDPDADPLSAVLVSGPANGTLTLNADGSFSYVPNANFNGADSFTYKANDGTADSNVATVSINVIAVNDPPQSQNDAYSLDEDTTLTVAPASGVLVNDTDVESDPLTAALVSGPQHGTLTLNADGTFTYTPDANFNGTDGFSYMANDGTDNGNVAAVTITVNPVNDPPVAVDDSSYSTDEDTPLVVTTGGVLANDTDVENDPLTAALVDAPQHGTVTLNADGTFTYTPEANFNGTDGFTYKANDGTADSNVAAVTITVNPVNDPPVAVNDDSYSTDEDTPLVVTTGGVLANDTDVENDPLTAALVDAPQHGTVTLNADGTFTYTPEANFNGTDGFTYKANDGTADSNVAAVTITVNPVNDPPVAVDDSSYSTDEDTPLVVTTGGVLANDTDVENDPLTAALVDAPQHGTVTLNADGTF
ncbi:MAG TPA: cadherin-like domain-containing protein, partial [Pirellulales bacterium]|nr:cadherin-like domain-containing protein [Pirellulales bacterium]